MSEMAGESSGGGKDVLKLLLHQIMDRVESIGTEVSELKKSVGVMENSMAKMHGASEVQDMRGVVQRLTSLEVWRGEIQGRTAMTAVAISGIVSIIAGIIVFFLTKGAR
mgnify:CR=1 FL=1